MKLSKLLIPIVLLTVVGAVMLISQKDQSVSVQTTQSKKISASSQYIEYNSDTYEQFSNNRRVLFFYANWCPLCRPADAEISANSDKIPEDVVIIRVNYNDNETDDAEKTLAKKYSVTYQHTFVQIDSNGNEVTRWTGGKLDELLENIKTVTVEKQATFSIYTKGLLRVFTAPMYHNLSKDVYIDAENPSIIKIKKPGITWDDFFSTLPFKLTHDCLTTGTKETFCTGNNGTLSFVLNGTEVREFLNLEIQHGDKLLITFDSE